MFALANKDHLPDDFAAAANIWPVSLSYSAISLKVMKWDPSKDNEVYLHLSMFDLFFCFVLLFYPLEAIIPSSHYDNLIYT
jgi:hypothetical protein